MGVRPIAVVLALVGPACGRVGFDPAGSADALARVCPLDSTVAAIDAVELLSMTWDRDSYGLVWTDGGTWFARLGNDGSFVVAPTLIGTGPSQQSQRLRIARDPENWIVGWASTQGADVVRVDPAGNVLGFTTLTSDPDGAPHLAGTADGFGALWQDYRIQQSSGDLRFQMFEPDGTRRGPEVVVVPSLGGIYEQDIVALGSDVVVVTEGNIEGPSVVRFDANGGEAWRVLLGGALGDAFSPKIATSGDELAVVWTPEGRLVFTAVSLTGVAAAPTTIVNSEAYAYHLTWTGIGYDVIYLVAIDQAYYVVTVDRAGTIVGPPARLPATVRDVAEWNGAGYTQLWPIDGVLHFGCP